DVITERQQLGAEAREYVRSSADSGGSSAASGAGSAGRTLALNFSHFDDPAQILAKAAIEGTVLEIAEIASVLSFAEQTANVKRGIQATERRFPHLAAEAAHIGDFHPLLRDLGGKILPSGELDDHASIELRRIRREIEKQRGTILSSLRNFLRAEQDDAAQEEIITVRGDRYVVPIRASRKSRAPGVVHGASSTGQTVYIEPLDAIELNNDLVRLREEEQ